mgnify:CR=1 FL=1
MTVSRRYFVGMSAVALASAAAVSGRAQAASIPEAVTATSPAMQPPVAPQNGQSYQPVVTLNGWTLPWRTNGDWKEFHLVAEPVVREMALGALRHSHAQIAVAVSGVAGPGGGTPDKPVGTVCFGWARAPGKAVVQTRRFRGDRDDVRRKTVAHALRGILAQLALGA